MLIRPEGLDGRVRSGRRPWSRTASRPRSGGPCGPVP